MSQNGSEYNCMKIVGSGDEASFHYSMFWAIISIILG